MSVQLQAAASLMIFAFHCPQNDIDIDFSFHNDLTLICHRGLRNLNCLFSMTDLTNFVFLSHRHRVRIACFFSLFLSINLQFSNRVMELLRGLSCGLLYMGRKHTEQMSVYTFRPKATLVHRENHGTLFFVLEGRAYSDVWPVLYLCLSYKCPPSISCCVRLKKH